MKSHYVRTRTRPKGLISLFFLFSLFLFYLYKFSSFSYTRAREGDEITRKYTFDPFGPSELRDPEYYFGQFGRNESMIDLYRREQ